MNTDGLSSGVEAISGKLSSGVKAVGNLALQGAQVIGASTAAAAGVLVGLGKEAINCYADFEQLVGGVETLFGAGGLSIEEYADSVGQTVDAVSGKYQDLMEAQSTVLENANKAYETAGLSANAYMETVTSFSAALISSLDGDTVKAAEVADRAIVDMSDNANKMGSSMESIQNAYQGFAKQNYTMLDNLKLGYGGTKEEMQRLLVDAGKLAEQEFDLSSYADIVEAIHVIQDNMGITGTTAKEAATTIQGSIGMMKAAWTNFLTGMADPDQDFDVLLGNVVDSVVTVADNLIPRISALLPRLVTGISEVVQSLSGHLPDIVQQLLPALIGGASTLVGELITAIPAILQVLIPTLISSFQEVFSGLLAYFSDAGSRLGGVLSSALSSVFGEDFCADMEEWFWYLYDIIENFAGNTIAAVAGEMGNLIDMFASLADAVKPLAENVLLGLVYAFDTLLSCWNDVFVPLITTVIDIFCTLVSTILEAVAPAITNICSVFDTLYQVVVEVIQDAILPIISSFIGMIQELWTENQDKIQKIGELFSIVFGKITEIVAFFVETFRNCIYPFILWLASFIEENMVGVQAIFQTVFDAIGGIIDFFIALFTGKWSDMWEASTILEAVAPVITNICSAFDTLYQVVVEVIQDAILPIISSFIGMIQELWTENQDKIQKIGELFSIIFGKITEIVAFFVEIFGAVFGKITEIVAFFVETFRNCIYPFILWLASFIEENMVGVQAIFQTVFDAIGGITDFFIALFTGKWSDMWEAVKTIVLSVFRELPSQLVDIGKKVVENLWQGISAMTGWIADKIGGFISGLFGQSDGGGGSGSSSESTSVQSSGGGAAVQSVSDTAAVSSVSGISSPVSVMQVQTASSATQLNTASVRSLMAGYEEEGAAGTETSYINGNVQARLGTVKAATEYARQQEVYANISNVTRVYLEGDAKGVFKLVKQENDIRKKSTGRSGLE